MEIESAVPSGDGLELDVGEDGSLLLDQCLECVASVLVLCKDKTLPLHRHCERETEYKGGKYISGHRFDECLIESIISAHTELRAIPRESALKSLMSQLL